MTSFEVNYLGLIHDVNLGSNASQTTDVQLIDRVEEAQLEGKIRMFAIDEANVVFTVSKYGIRVSNLLTKEVVERYPLHTVAQVVVYTDAFSKTNLALKIGQVGRRVFDCYVVQCRTQDQAQGICERISSEFDAIGSDHKL